MILPITIEVLTANSDGLYRLADLDTRMADAMAEYEAIEDAPTDVAALSKPISANAPYAYTLSGTQATANTQGVIIEQGQKIIRSH